MSTLLMPRATAVWLVGNTSLTFEQIAEFCGLHTLEVQAIADEEVAVGMHGLDPVANGQITKEELERVQKDPAARLKIVSTDNLPQPVSRNKGPRYTPIAKRGDKPDAISWLVKNYPDMTDGQIGKLLGTTKSTIAAVRDRTHWNSQNIRPRNPVALGLCTQADLDAAATKAGVVLPSLGVRYMTAEEAATIPAPKPLEPHQAGQERERGDRNPFGDHRR
ncbi:MAG: DUF1013 domain-containing protein [Alphaproteobacteria bacterium]|nr:DUF1013 domain-containing protein [Alphaproteobacteria bacterium]